MKTPVLGTKPRGKKAKVDGALVKRGRVMSLSVYPRKRMKSVIVKAAAAAGRSVSNYILYKVLLAAAVDQSTTLESLLPEEEYKAVVLKEFTYRYKKGRANGN